MNDRAAAAIADFLTALNIDVTDARYRRTPERVAALYESLFSGLNRNPGEIFGENFPVGNNSLVAVRHIPFFSVCEHHLMPFFGETDIVYLPSQRGVAGFGKFVELVKILSRRPQLQERLTEEIAAEVMTGLAAQGVLVTLKAKQLCLLAKGETTFQVQTVTSAALGALSEGRAYHREAVLLLHDE